MTILSNYPLLSALAAIVLAQLVKVPLNLLFRGEWKPTLALGTGGMPSSHSAAVAALAASIGIRYGFDSAGFAIAAVVCAITMYDAAGVRRHAGMHASAINQLLDIFGKAHSLTGIEERKKLKELLGHRPIEVFAGAVFGAAVGVLFGYMPYWQ